MSYAQKTSGFEAYTVRAGYKDMEWATIVIRGWQAPGNDGTPREIGEILIHSSYGSWAYQWGHLGQPFKQWLAECDDPSYVASKFMGADAYKFDGERSLADCRRSLIEDRRHGGLTKTEAREIWDWLDENESELTCSEDRFVQVLLDGQSHIVPTNGAMYFLSEPWDRAARSLDRDFVNFWNTLMPPFQQALRYELQAAKEAA